MEVVGSEEYWAKFHSKCFKKKEKKPPPQSKPKSPKEKKEKKSFSRKEYYQAHKEEERLYYQSNKLEITEKKNKKCTCECGGKYTVANTAKHLLTKRHQAYTIENPRSTKL